MIAQFTFVPVPEPSSTLLLLFGIIIFAFRRLFLRTISLAAVLRHSIPARPVLVVAALGSSISVIAADQTVVIPTSLTATPASGAQFPFGDQLRYQNIYNSADFLAATPEQMVITSVSFRLDESRQNSLSAIIPDIEIRMGTASGSTPPAILDYSVNIGADYRRVFRGPLQFTAIANGATVNPFSITFFLSEGFYYDPRKGGLVVDLLVHDGTPGVLIDSDGSASSGFAISGPLSATIGSGIAPPLVPQFSFQAVPEPGIVELSVFAAVMFVVGRRKHGLA